MLVALKALVVILAVGMIVFALARPALSPLVGVQTFLRWRNAWFVIVVAGFVTPSIWAVFCVTGFVAWYAARDEQSPVPIFMVLLLALPSISIEIPGFGLARVLIPLDHVRLLILVLLLPAAFRLHADEQSAKLGSLPIDRFLLAYLALDLLLYLPFSSLTNNIRKAVLFGLDVVIPYYVFSRSLKTPDALKRCLAGFALGVALIGPIAVFETIRKWPVYTDLQTVWNVKAPLIEFLMRDDLLRAQASSGHPLVLGYVSVVALGCWLYVSRHVTSKAHVWLGHLAIAGGLGAAVSRGPWLGAVIVLVVHATLSPKPLASLTRIILPAVGLGAAVLVSPWSGKLINLLPFVGQVDVGSVTYRQMLLEYSLEILKHSPFFGNPGFMAFLEDLRQGQGIIDIVNSYLGIALRTGGVGLMLFVMSFVLALHGMWQILGTYGRESDEGALARALFATLVAILVMIASVSGISVVPYVYWSLLGVAAAHMQVARVTDRRAAEGAQVDAPPPEPTHKASILSLRRASVRS